MRSIIKDKRGVSLSGWSEVAIFCILFIGTLVVILVNMDAIYTENHATNLGFDTNTTIQAYQKSQLTSLQTQIAEGKANTDTITGLSLSNIWGLILSGANAVWGFISGSWIETAVALTGITTDYPVALGLRILYLISIGFIIIKLILKVKA